MGLRFRLGLFDPIDDQPLWKVGRGCDPRRAPLKLDRI